MMTVKNMRKILQEIADENAVITVKPTSTRRFTINGEVIVNGSLFVDDKEFTFTAGDTFYEVKVVTRTTL